MRESRRVRREQTRVAEATAFAEVGWFFTCVRGRVPKAGEAPLALRKAATTIRGWLNAIPTFHVGALWLRFTPRDWPGSVAAEFGGWTSLVVRLECAGHPSYGKKDSELETAAVMRLEELLDAPGRRPKRELTRLGQHALEHVRAAIRAYVEVRGPGPSVLPPAGKVVIL